jgi:hypothetical protein
MGRLGDVTDAAGCRPDQRPDSDVNGSNLVARLFLAVSPRRFDERLFFVAGICLAATKPKIDLVQFKRLVWRATD